MKQSQPDLSIFMGYSREENSNKSIQQNNKNHSAYKNIYESHKSINGKTSCIILRTLIAYDTVKFFMTEF